MRESLTVLDWTAKRDVVRVKVRRSEIVFRVPPPRAFRIRPTLTERNVVKRTVEPFFAWISRDRFLWKAPEATLASAGAFLQEVAAMILVRRLARSA